MCHNDITVYRCGYRSQKIIYCSKAPLNFVMGKYLMCDERSSTVSSQADSLCSTKHRNCELQKKGGVWICCLCEFGYKDSDRNGYQYCTSCSHEVCEDCKEWNAENVAALVAANAEQEQQEETEASEEEEEEEKEEEEE